MMPFWVHALKTKNVASCTQLKGNACFQYFIIIGWHGECDLNHMSAIPRNIAQTNATAHKHELSLALRAHDNILQLLKLADLQMLHNGIGSMPDATDAS